MQSLSCKLRLRPSFDTVTFVSIMIVRFLKKESAWKKCIGIFIFIAYFIMLLYFTIFSESLGRTLGSEQPRYNLVFFTEIKRFWNYREQLGLWACFMNIFGNIIAFMPVGYLLPAICEGRKSFVDAVCAGFVTSLLIECTQYVFRVGSFDVDDILLNTLGAALGFICWLIVHKYVDLKTKERVVIIRKIEADE